MTALEYLFTAGVCLTAFCFGITVGSFLNVCILRLPKGESIVKSNSHCPRCGTPIKKRDLIPLFSWLALRGKCRSCGEKISPRYMLVEGLTGVMFALAFLSRDLINDGIVYAILLCIFIAFIIEIGFEDFDTKEMSVGVLVLFGAFVCVSRALCYFFPRTLRDRAVVSLEDGLLGAVAVSVPFLLFGFLLTPVFYNAFICPVRREARGMKKRMKTARAGEVKRLEKELALIKEKIADVEPVYGFGMGDVILMGIGGLMLGVKAVIFAAFAAVILGAVYAGFLAVKRRRGGDVGGEFAFGPFLCAGLAAAVFIGTDAFDLYASSLTLEPPPQIEEYDLPDPEEFELIMPTG